MTDYMIITREKTISAPVEAVAAQIVDFKNWVNWSPWEEVDPNLERSYGGEDNGVGATYAWKGNKKAGAGEMIITTVEPHQILIDLNFEKPFKSASKTIFEFSEEGDQTKVTWTVKSPKSFMTKIAGLFMNFDKAIGQDLEKGLDKLQNTCGTN